MREIKFRAYEAEWCQKEHGKRRMLYSKEDFGDYCEPHGLNGTIKALQEEEHILMQYTGLKDKNGKEIYEGDLIQVSDIGIAEVVYGFYVTSTDDWDVKHGTVGFTLKWVGSSFEDHSELQPSDDLKIIGNIHENPELLEQK